MLFRSIANTITDAQKIYFDQNLKGRNDLTETQYLAALTDAGIGYFTDQDTIPLPLRSLVYVGEFSVLQIFDDNIQPRPVPLPPLLLPSYPRRVPE